MHSATVAEIKQFNGNKEETMLAYSRTLIKTHKPGEFITLDDAEYGMWDRASIKASIRVAAREVGLIVTFRGDTFRISK